MQVLLYDDKEMHVWEVTGYFPKPPEMTEWDVTGLEDMLKKTVIIPKGTYTAEITTGEVKAELDPTTMKQIARYNLEKDFEELNHQIKSAEDRLNLLNQEMETNEKKLDFMRKMCQRIWDDDCFDEDDYALDKNDDCEEDEWE